MKKFISLFIIIILAFGFVIGHCNSATETYYEDDMPINNDTKLMEDVSSSTSTAKNFYDNETVYAEKETFTHYDSIRFVMIPSSFPNLLLKRTAYLISYNNLTLCPNWVAWHLTAEHADGALPRDNVFYEDIDVPSPRATNDDYRGSGWSRGHMCPAGDNKWNSKAMQESNLLTNICPQDHSLNSGLWNRIEQDCRRWAKKYGGVYIVCGPIFYNQEHEAIGNNEVFVPEAFFKVILCLEGKPKAIGFVVKNNAGAKKKDQYINTVDEVERITGYDFFPALPDSIEDIVEAYSNLEDWK